MREQQEKPETKDFNSMIKSMRGLDSERDLFEQMHERGQGITFSHLGAPLIQKLV